MLRRMQADILFHDPITPSTVAPKKEEQMFGSSMGKLTIDQRGTGWIVCEDGRRVGGTVRHPFTSQAAAQRYVDAELKGEAETMAAGDVGLSACARVIRETDHKVWAKVERIEKKFADDADAAQAAHVAAGTWIVMIKMALASAEAEGKIECSAELYRIRGPAS
jgi:hypothetical protein